MKKSLFTVSVLFISFILQCNAQQNVIPFQWNEARERTHNDNRNNPQKWDIKNWKVDIQMTMSGDKPMFNGVFPTPNYDLADNTFNGLGNTGEGWI